MIELCSHVFRGAKVPITFAPARGAILLCDFDLGRIDPEMDKKRQVIVVSLATLNHKHATLPGHCTVVPVSSQKPITVGPEDVFLPVGKYWSFGLDSWVRCKMVDTVSHTRLNLLYRNGARQFRSEFIDDADMLRIVTGLKFVLGIA
jgi:uncharacterized protein YifN (PemK superfamily)